eukprot:5505834-Pyramimonas_sp.AAC.1
MIDVSNSAAIELLLGRVLRFECVYHLNFLASPFSGPKGKNKWSSSSLQLAVFDEAAISLGLTKDSG